MPHPANIIHCTGPRSPHAFDGIPLRPRRGELDALCPHCQGHGGWNAQIDLASQRAIRAFCDQCDARGWIETGDDLVSSPDIEMSPEGYPQWITRLEPPD